MEVFKIKEGSIYNPESRTDWVKINMPLDVALIEYTGRTTIMILFKEHDYLSSVTIPSVSDFSILSNDVADCVIEKIRDKLLKI